MVQIRLRSKIGCGGIYPVTGIIAVPRFTGKTRITGKITEIPERPKNNREILICPSQIKKAIIDY